MFIGVPREIKTDEYRVGLTPTTIKELTAKGHRVAIETKAGVGAGIADQELCAAGAGSAKCDRDISTRRPDRQGEGAARIGARSNCAAARSSSPICIWLLILEQTHDLMASGVTAIAYETVTDAVGKLPLLAPMSTVAGRMAAQVAAHFLQRPQGGRGILLGRIEGAPSAEVVVLGGGVVGTNAAEMAIGMGGQCHRRRTRPRDATSPVAAFWRSRQYRHGASQAIEALCTSADVVIGAALVAGGAAPKLVSARTITAMKPGSVIVDVSIDQGGCAETSHPTTHSRPTFLVDGVVHYCVATHAWRSAENIDVRARQCDASIHSRARGQRISASIDRRCTSTESGLNVHDGKVTCRAVSDALRLPYTAAAEVLKIMVSPWTPTNLDARQCVATILPEMFEKIRSITWTMPSPMER